ncbi:sigma-70 family RNA polymerase sigma factor [Enterococcus sp. CR-Ec1]|uniref:sigma-70 family RNA polymerase sigma factor n=1 Tax=Enterococcus sp. CR-Ec1 TaxID=2057791 RepID=UPI000C75C0B7|nr:sigma-70 family RNA polymerase sigma factor [Enterococcus sp. CR-Ec1]AUJ86519.1 sigma-70 family RNA polymerase sigma factor [Enterococcus sp. CR-Ec1]
MAFQDEKIEAQLTKYFSKVICNAASNYYRKKFRYAEKEYISDTILENMEGTVSLEEDIIQSIMINESEMNIFSYDSISDLASVLNEREKELLIEKFVFEKTDQEIGVLFGISRQGVTNMKLRLYKKLKEILSD